MRRGAARFLESLGELHTRGLAVDWERVLPGGHRVDLPTYAFQRERFWPAPATPQRSGGAPLGQTPLDHPLVGAAVALADGGGVLLTGRLSLSDHPWLAGHAVFDQVILPGAAVVDLALSAAHHVGLDRVDELIAETPVALPGRAALLLQLRLGGPDETGRRSLAVHTRPEAAPPDAPWTRHVTGTLAPATASESFDLRAWPPPGAAPVPLDGLYRRLAEAGLHYGPDFQGLSAVWRRGEALFAEVTLAEAAAGEAGRFALHPALLDAALHALAVDRDDGVQLPFMWTGVSLRAVGATTARVRLERRPAGSVSVSLADATGEPVASVEALLTRPVSRDELKAALASGHHSLHRVDWFELPVAPPSSPLRVERYTDPAALRDAVEQRTPLPDVAVVPLVAGEAPTSSGRPTRPLPRYSPCCRPGWTRARSRRGSSSSPGAPSRRTPMTTSPISSMPRSGGWSAPPGSSTLITVSVSATPTTARRHAPRFPPPSSMRRSSPSERAFASFRDWHG